MFRSKDFGKNLEQLGTVTDSLSKTLTKMDEQKSSSLLDWAHLALSKMCKELFDITKTTGFQEKFLNLVKEEISNEDKLHEMEKESNRSF